jgi:MFS family permease
MPDMNASTGNMRNVLLITCAFFFNFAGFSTAQQYLTVTYGEQSRGHLALVSLFLLYGAFLVTSVFVAKLVQLLGGLKRSLLIGALTYSVFVASIALGNVLLLLVASIIVGIGAGLFWVSSGQIIADNSNEHTAGRNFSLQIVGQTSGSIAGIYLGGFLIQAVSMQLMYVVLTLVTLAGFLFLPWIQSSKETVAERVFRPFFAFDKRMLALFPIVYAAYYLAGQSFTAVNPVVIGLLGISSIPFVISIFMIGRIAGSLSIGTLSGWLSKSSLLIGLALVSFLGILIFTMTTTLPPLLVGAILIGFSISAVYPVCLAWLKDRLGSEEYLSALGVFQIYTNIGIVSAIVINLYASSRTSFIPAVVAVTLAIPGTFLFDRLTRK